MVERVNFQVLENFITRAYMALGMRIEDARVDSKVLVTADLRGIESHGVGNIRLRLESLERGQINLNPKMKVIRETVSSALLDADHGFGSVAGVHAMEICIEKAKKTGVGLVSVHDSTHYGIAAYYSMLALEHDMIGVSMTNSIPLMVPTHGRNAVLGTNPISVAAPAGDEFPFVLDMATSVVAAGKLAVAERRGESIPNGWVLDENGKTINDPGKAQKMIYSLGGGGLLPLGGSSENLGGHKGYGLSLMVDILTGVLSGSSYGPFALLQDNGNQGRNNVGHIFCAISIDAFRDVFDFRNDMDRLFSAIRDRAGTSGQDRIYIHGEKEFILEEERRRLGIPLHNQILKYLAAVAKKLKIDFDII